MTSRRALHSTSPTALYSSTKTPDLPGQPTTPPRQRTVSGVSSQSEDEVGPIMFMEIGEEDKERLWSEMKRSLGVR